MLVVSTASGVRDAATRARPRWPKAVGGGAARGRQFPAHWPLFVLFAGYPLWWVLGIGNFLPLVLTIPMVVRLARSSRLKAPPGFGVWLCFLIWLVIGVLLLQVDAPGAVPGSSGSRYITWTYRFCWYLTATVLLLYVGNIRGTLTNGRLCHMASYMFIVVVAGGLLGTFVPHLQFPSLLELLLPHSVSQAGYLNSLIHPSAAQIQSFLGYDQGRPSAPFAFSNEWGINYAVFLPFFIAAWLPKRQPRKRLAGLSILLISLVPVVSSLNRGLWLALLIASAFLAVRAALLGKGSMLGGLALVLLLGTLVIVFSPLGSLVSDRLAHPNSNTGRTHLGTQTFLSTLQGSPIIGFGTTRDPSGNWNSIAAGSTPSCPRCTPPPLGTQGQLWLVMFSQGFGGLLLYLAFIAIQFFRNLLQSSPFAVAALAVLVMHAVTMPFYNAIDTSLLGILMAVGLLWRVRIDSRPERLAGQDQVAR